MNQLEMDLDNNKIDIEVLDLNQQALVLQSNGKIDKALELLHKALTIDSMCVDTYINIGNIYAAEEQYEQAKAQYEKALLVDKHDGRIYFNIGNINCLQNDYAAGIKNYNQAIAEGIDESILYYNLGLVYEEQNNTDLAFRNYSKAIYKDQGEPTYRLKKALLQIKCRLNEEALDTLSELIKISPDLFEGYHYKFEVLCALKRYEEAGHLLEFAADLFPNDISIFYDKIHLQTRLGNIDTALAMIAEAEQMDSYEVEKRNLTFEKGTIYGMKEDLEHAIQCFEKCKEFETDGEMDYEARYFLMTIYLGQNNLEKVLLNAEEMLRDPKDNPFGRAALYYRPYALKFLGQVEKAKSYYKEALSLYRWSSIHSPTEVDIYFFRALCLRDIEEYSKALDMLDFVATLVPTSSEVHVIRSSIFEMTGRHAEAQQEKELAKKLKPELDLVFN